MISLRTFVRGLVIVAILGAPWLAPSRSRADMPDATTLFDYSFKGFTLGVELGLAVGYIATGPRYEKSEWKKLVIGMGMGALVGMTTGIVIAVVDATHEGVPLGYYVLRDAAYGTVLGALMGSVVGILLWVDDGSSKDILKGAAFGTLFGVIAGAGYGVIEGSNAKPPRRKREGGFLLGQGVHAEFSPIASAGGFGVGALVRGVF